MKHSLLAASLAAGILAFTTSGAAQFAPVSVQTPGFNGNAAVKGKRNGPNDGTGNQGQRPQDGTGYGAKSGNRSGSGTCDGTGPKGRSSQGRGGGRR